MILPIRLCRLGYQCLEDVRMYLRRRRLPFDKTIPARIQHRKHLRLAMEWLRLSHKATGFRGSSKGFSYLFGWQDPFPETTGYIAKTFLEYADFCSETVYLDEGLQMLDFLCKIQRGDGGIIEGTLSRSKTAHSTIFDTGMVMAGWLKGYEVTKNSKYLDALIRAGGFLAHARKHPELWLRHSYNNIPHTYHSRVAWVLLDLYLITDDTKYLAVATDIYEWVLDQQIENGYFQSCLFSLDRPTYNTHAFAYALRGLLEGYLVLRDERYLEAVEKTSRPFLEYFEAHKFLPTLLNQQWVAESKTECLTGIAQHSIVWFELYQITKNTRYLSAAVNGVDLLCVLQNTNSLFKEIRGAVKGSHPIWGRYAPLQYPNWATKFFADALMLRIGYTDTG